MIVWKKRLELLILISLLSSSLNIIQSVQAIDDVKILSHSGYLDSSGNYHIIGELQNIGSQPINYVQVTATYYDSRNATIDTRFDLSLLYTILPGRRSPFEIILLDAPQSKKVNSYSLKVGFQVTPQIPQRLLILKHSMKVDADGRMHISGEIRNVGNEIPINAKVIATCYDSWGNTVAASGFYFDPELTGDIRPNQSAPFDIFIEKERTPLIKRYELTAESNQYVLLPQDQYVLTISIVGSGTVSRVPESDTYAPGSSVKLTATPAEGWTFSNWGGNITGGSNPSTMIIINHTYVTAIFTKSPGYGGFLLPTLIIITLVLIITISYILLRKRPQKKRGSKRNT